MELSDEYHAPKADGGHVRIYTERELRSKMRGAGLEPGASHQAHALHTPVLVAEVCRRARPTTTSRWSKLYNRLLVWDIEQRPAVTRVRRATAEPGAGQEPRRLRRPSRSTLASDQRVAAADQGRSRASACGQRRAHRRRGLGHRRRHRRLAAAKRNDPLVPRRSRRPVEPRRGGHGPRPRRATHRSRACLRLAGRPCSAPTARGTSTTWPTASNRTSSTPTPSPTSRPVCGTTGCSPTIEGSSNRCGRSSNEPSSSCSICRRHAARSSGPATPTARRGPSPCSPARRASATACAAPSRLAELLGHERPDWELSAARLADVDTRPLARRFPTPSRRSTAGRWTGTTRCSPVCLSGEVGREHLDSRARRSSSTGMGVRCVSDRPWMTAAETCECLLAYLSVGEHETATDAVPLGPTVARRRRALLDRDRLPREVHFPGGEKSTYTAASVVLAADALGRHEPGLGVVRRPRRCCRRS